MHRASARFNKQLLVQPSRACIKACQHAVCRMHGRADLNKEDWKSVDAWIAGVMTSLQELSLRTVGELGGAYARSKH